MQIYQLKLVLRGISPQIWRRVLVDADTSLADLHQIFQIAMGWQDQHLHRFRIHGKHFGITYPGGIVFRDDPNQVRLSQFRLRPGERFLYEYDFAERWRLDVRLEAILPAEPQQVYPLCSAGKHACPPEECGGVEDYLANRHLLEQTQQQDLEVLTEFTVQVAQRQPDEPALGLSEDSEEYTTLVLAAQRTQARAHLTAGSYERHEINQQLRALPLCCEVSDALSAPGGLHR